nr:amidohydrolase family protein [Arthrobacter sp. ISL-72]
MANRPVRTAAHPGGRAITTAVRPPGGSANQSGTGPHGPAGALEGYTSHAARAAGDWSVAGSVTTGKRADFTVFDTDPLLAAPDELAAAQVLATFVDGRVQHLAVGAVR